MPCRTCEAILPTKVEQEIGLCFSCLASVEKVNVVNEKLIAALQEDFAKITKEATEARAKVAGVLSLLRAETEGIRASEAQMPEDQNPYPPGTESCVMWLNGWQSVETKRHALKAQAVMLWSVENLSLVHELLLGYGYQELAQKTNLVLDKMKQFLPEGG